jgi:hypothetical protein
MTLDVFPVHLAITNSIAALASQAARIHFAHFKTQTKDSIP